MAAYLLLILLIGPGHGTCSEVNLHPILLGMYVLPSLNLHQVPHLCGAEVMGG